MTWELKCGRWQDVLADVAHVDHVVTDPPYSARTHEGHNNAEDLDGKIGRHPRANGGFDRSRSRSRIEYEGWQPSDVEEFVDSWAPRVQSWMACLTDSDLQRHYQASYKVNGLTDFQPVPCVVRGMTVRLAGDGPSSWAVYLMVGRTKAAHGWGTLCGAYDGPQGERLIAGAKSLALMRKIVRDYSRPGDLICDPFAGSGTTLLAAVMEGRNAIGAEMDPGRYQIARERLEAFDRNPQLPGVVMHAEQTSMADLGEPAK